MKTKKKGILGVFTVVVALILVMAFTACERPEGPMGPEGQSSQNTISLVDANGTFIGTVLDVSGVVITTGNFTFQINLITGEIAGSQIRATEQNGQGDIVSTASNNNAVVFPNIIIKNNGKYYQQKDRGNNGYITNVLSSTKSYLSNNSDNWANSEMLGAYARLEEIQNITSETQFGLPANITPPLRYIW